MNIDPDFDIQHRDCYESLQAMADAGGADLILTSPPYPDARSDAAYGASFDTTLAGYGRLGDAVFAALKPGGVCALNIDGPVRVWRAAWTDQQSATRVAQSNAELSERSLMPFKVGIDWSENRGFRYVDRAAYVRSGQPGDFGPRWRHGHELVHIFSRPGGRVHFNPEGYQRRAQNPGQIRGQSRTRNTAGSGGWHTSQGCTQGEWSRVTNTLPCAVNGGTIDRDHEAPFAADLADAYVLCYSPPGGLVGDPFVGSGTVAHAVHRAGEGRRFIGGDLGIRQTHKGKPCGRRWADIVNDGLRQGRLFS